MRFLAHLSTGSVKIPFDCRRCNTNSLISYWCYFGCATKKSTRRKPDAVIKKGLFALVKISQSNIHADRYNVCISFLYSVRLF